MHVEYDKTYIYNLCKYLKFNLSHFQKPRLYLIFRGDSEWQWPQGKSLSFTHWENEYPQNDKSKLCTVLEYNSEVGSGKWKNVNCFEVCFFIGVV